MTEIADLFCGLPFGGIERFKAENQIPIYPGRWNLWVIARDMDDGATPEQINEEIQALFGGDFFQKQDAISSGWFEGRGRPTNISVGHYRPGSGQQPSNGELFDAARLDDALSEAAEKYQGSSSPVLSADIQTGSSITGEVDPPITLGGETMTLITVAFVYRGDDEAGQMPWPVAKQKWVWGPPSIEDPVRLYASGWCPVDATYAVTEVLAPQTQAPPIPEDPDKAIEWNKLGADLLKRGESVASTYAGYTAAAVAVLGLAALGYAIRSIR